MTEVVFTIQATTQSSDSSSRSQPLLLSQSRDDNNVEINEEQNVSTAVRTNNIFTTFIISLNSISLKAIMFYINL